MQQAGLHELVINTLWQEFGQPRMGHLVRSWLVDCGDGAQGELRVNIGVDDEPLSVQYRLVRAVNRHRDISFFAVIESEESLWRLIEFVRGECHEPLGRAH